MMDVSRAATFALRALAVMGVAIAILSYAQGHKARAQVGDLTGVYCLDLYTDGQSPITPKGNAHQGDDGIDGGVHNGEPETKLLTRIESGGGGTWDLTSVSYRGDGGLVVTAPPTADPCPGKGDGNSLSVAQQPIETLERPTTTATVVVKTSDKNLTWDICSFEADLSLWINTRWEVVIDASPPYFGTLFVDGGGTEAACDTPATGSLARLVVEMYKRDANAGSPSGGLDDDWDGDGVTDWNELAINFPSGYCDPFSPPPCDVVGGVAGLPEVTSAPAQAPDSAGGGVNTLVATAIALAAGATGIVAGVWYLRRRRADG